EKAMSACDPEEIREAFGTLSDSARGISTTYATVLCSLEANQCLIQPAIFNDIQAEAETFGLVAAFVISASDSLSVNKASISVQLKTLWIEMRDQVTCELREAFAYWEKHELCVPSFCYENATLGLRNAIENGIADSANFADSAGCSEEQKTFQHSEIIHRATTEVTSLQQKAIGLPRAPTCVFTRLGALALRLHAVLGRNRIEAADFVKNTMKSWKDTVEWFRDTDDDPTPAVARQLRKI